MKFENRPMVIQNKIQLFGESYSTDYFDNTNQMVGQVHGLLLHNFADSGYDNFIEFLDDSFKNDPYLNDLLEECDFTVEGKSISVVASSEKYIAENMGNYKMHLKGTILDVYISGNWSYIIDKNRNRRYRYYGD